MWNTTPFKLADQEFLQNSYFCSVILMIGASFLTKQKCVINDRKLLKTKFKICLIFGLSYYRVSQRKLWNFDWNFDTFRFHFTQTFEEVENCDIWGWQTQICICQKLYLDFQRLTSETEIFRHFLSDFDGIRLIWTFLLLKQHYFPTR